MYKLTQNGVINLKENKFIPNDPANKDWQEYQKWLKKGNTPIPEYVLDEDIDKTTFTFDKKIVFQKILQQKEKELLLLEKQRLSQILDQYGYNGLADVQFYANQTTPDQEAQALLKWYQAYDDGIWNYITVNLSKITTIKKLLALDLKAVEEQIYQQSIKTSPLP